MSTRSATDLKVEFEERGYVVLPGFFSSAEVDGLRQEIVSAGGKLEEESALNKGQMVFYSNVFLKSEPLRSFICQDRLIEFLSPIIGPDFWVRWDQCVAKGPGAPDFPWHQDNAYNDLKVPHFQLWVGITEMTEHNGGLWLQPGSHKQGLLPHHRVGKHMVCDSEPESPVLVRAAKGDLVLFSSLMLHHTKTNFTDGDRWAYVIEYMSLHDYDPFIEPPYLVVAEEGKRVQKFVMEHRGSRSLRNKIKYHGVWGETKRAAKQLLNRLPQ